MKKIMLLMNLLLASFGIAYAQNHNLMEVDTKAEPIDNGMFQPSWQSLSQYKVPDWYRNAKFGIWAHWGPQCQAEQGDWYARGMYEEGSNYYKWQLANYGHPSKAG